MFRAILTLSIRGGHHLPFGSFNALTVNANGTGEEYIALQDASLQAGAALGGGRNDYNAPGRLYETVYDGHNLFHGQDQGGIGIDGEERQVEAPDVRASTKRNELGAHEDYPARKLDDLGVGTLSLAGQTAKQVCLEATFEFLQKVSGL